MRRFFFTVLIFFCSWTETFTQDWVIGGGVFMGTYFGDLSPSSLKQSWSDLHPAYGLYISRRVFSKFFVTADYQYGVLSGDDKNSLNSGRKLRNLNFSSPVSNLNLMGSARVRVISRLGFLLSGGVGVFKFEPRTTLEGIKYKLRLFGTEGQDLPGSSNKIYNNVQLSVPFQAGLIYWFSEKTFVEVALQFHYTFTDYIDDVSRFYFDNDIISSARGPIAAKLADRHLEIEPNSSPFSSGTPRGNSDQNDHFAFIKLGFGMNINSANQKKSGSGKIKCPKF